MLALKKIRLATVLLALMLGAIAWSYQDAPKNQLLNWDDHRYITENPKVQALSPANLGWMLTSTDLDNWHPLTWLSHALVYHFYGLNPAPHHVFNVLLHAANSVWVFLLFLILQNLAARQAFFAVPRQRVLIAALGALWFGIHPQHVESVVWVSEVKDVLSLFFLLPAFIAYCAYTLSNARRRYWYGLSLLCFVLAIMAKPMAVSFPIILLLADIYPLKRLNWQNWMRCLSEKWPFIIAAALSVVMTLLAQQHAMSNMDAIPLLQRVLNAAHSLIFYTQKWLLPLHLSAMYPYPDYAHILSNPWTYTAVTAVFLISALVLYRWLKHGDALWAVLWGFYVVTLLPVLGIVQVGMQAAADRYAYLPTLPFYLLAAVGVARLWQWRRYGVYVLIPALIALSLTLASLTRQQTWQWRDDIVFRQHIVAYDPNNAKFQADLAAEHFKYRDYHKSILHYRAAIKLKPLKFDYYSSLIHVYLTLGQNQDALDVLNFLIETQPPLDKPVYADIYIKAAELHCLGRDFSRAAQTLEKALALAPDHAGGRRLQADLANRACAKH
jgi:protein O-mannosyl-transferase